MRFWSPPYILMNVALVYAVMGSSEKQSSAHSMSTGIGQLRNELLGLSTAFLMQFNYFACSSLLQTKITHK